MSKPQTDHDLRSNQLLDALAPDCRKRIDPHLEPSNSSSAPWSAMPAACSSMPIFLKAPSVAPDGAEKTARPSRPPISAAKAHSACSPPCTAGYPSTDASCSSRAIRSGVRSSCCNTNSRPANTCAIFCQLLGDAAVAGSADGRLQFHAFDRRADVPMAPDDARPSGRRIASLHA